MSPFGETRSLSCISLRSIPFSTGHPTEVRVWLYSGEWSAVVLESDSIIISVIRAMRVMVENQIAPLIVAGATRC